MSTAAMRPSGGLIEAPEELGRWVRILAVVLLPIGPVAIGRPSLHASVLHGRRT